TTFTFSPTLSGTLNVANGGTGLSSTPSYGQLLVGNGTGYILFATSSLGIAISDTTGTLAITRGGTGTSTGGVTNGVEYYSGSTLTNDANFTYSSGAATLGTSLTVGTTLLN